MDHAVFSMAYTVKLYKIMQYSPHLTDEETGFMRSNDSAYESRAGEWLPELWGSKHFSPEPSLSFSHDCPT